MHVSLVVFMTQLACHVTCDCRRNFEAVNVEYPPNVDTLMARELNALSVEERDRIADEIHGIIHGAVDEEKSFLETKFQLLNEELGKVTGRSRAAYDLAMTLDPAYVTNRDFLLSFLRSDTFDVPKAASRILSHFQCKRNLFGDDKLARDITLDDLNKDDRSALLSGSHQFLGTKDVKGRTVVYYFPELFNYVSVQNEVRISSHCHSLLIFLSHILGRFTYNRYTSISFRS